MTEFEKVMKPYEEWVNNKLSQVVPKPETITPKICAAMIAQYQRELASDGDLADVRLSEHKGGKFLCSEHSNTFYDCEKCGCPKCNEAKLAAK